MGQAILRRTLRVAPAMERITSAPSTVVLGLRTGLVLGCAVAMGIAVWAGDPSGYLLADPDLARLLRGMALIKGMVVIAAVAAVLWRLAWPVSTTAAATYLVSSWALAGSTMLIWQLSHIVPAALMFHAAVIALLWVSWRERRTG